MKFLRSLLIQAIIFIACLGVFFGIKGAVPLDEIRPSNSTKIISSETQISTSQTASKSPQETNSYPMIPVDNATSTPQHPIINASNDPPNEELAEFDEDFSAHNIRLEFPQEASISKEIVTSDNHKASVDLLETTPVNLIGFSASSLNEGSQDVDVNQSFTVTFDTLPDQTMLNGLQFYPTANFQTIVHDKQLTVYPQRLHRLTNYVFGYKIQGVCLQNLTTCDLQRESWQYALHFQTSYKENYIYGHSVQGRDLMATIYGAEQPSGKTIMFSAGIHGTEWRSGALNDLRNYLNSNPSEIFSHQNKIIIITQVNPDGTANNNSYNAHDVNLNRNWATPDWGGGKNPGSAPFSEPESKQLADFILSERVGYLIAYHAQWPPKGIIFLGDDNDPETQNFARFVSNKSSYPIGFYIGNDGDDGSVAGDQTVWAATQGIKALVIESTGIQYSDPGQNFPMQLELIRNY